MSDEERDLVERFRAACAAPRLSRRWKEWSAWVDARCLVQIGETPLLLVVERGRIELREGLPPLTAWDFSVRGACEAWRALWQAVPAPGSHDIFALAKRRELVIEGDLRGLMANLQLFKNLLEAPRTAA